VGGPFEQRVESNESQEKRKKKKLREKEEFLKEDVEEICGGEKRR